MFKSLSFRIQFAVLGILTLSISGIMLANYFSNRNALINQTSQTLMWSIHESLRDGMIQNDISEIRRALSGVERKYPSSKVMILNNEGYESFTVDKKAEYVDIKEKGFEAAAGISGKTKGGFLQSFFPIPNEQVCRNCHESNAEYLGCLYLEFPLTEIKKNAKVNLAWHILLGATILISTALVLRITIRKSVIKPLLQAVKAANKFAEGRFGSAMPEAPSPEFEELFNTLGSLAGNISNVFMRVNEISAGISDTSMKIKRLSHLMEKGTGQQEKAVEKASVSLANIDDALKALSMKNEELHTSSKLGGKALNRVKENTENIGESMDFLSNIVEGSTSSIEEMSSSLTQVNEHIKTLSRSLENTFTDVEGFERSAMQIKERVGKSQKHAVDMRKHAEEGKKAVYESVESIDNIYKSSLEATGIIEKLVERSQEVGSILGIIEEISAQTNLLALNASIIAAQAKQHGKSFSVVADEIRDLAERTAQYTHEIDEIITGILQESETARNTIKNGLTLVVTGKTLARNAGNALDMIYSMAHKSEEMISVVGNEAMKQADASARMLSSLKDIVDMVSHIRKASDEQDRAGKYVTKAAEEMRSATQKVEIEVGQQKDANSNINNLIFELLEMISIVRTAAQEQVDNSSLIINAVEEIRDIGENNSRAVEKLEESITMLNTQSNRLSKAMDAVKLR